MEYRSAREDSAVNSDRPDETLSGDRTQPASPTGSHSLDQTETGGQTQFGRQISAGTLLARQYRIVGDAPLGSGGMGEVWKAEDTELSVPVAIKLLPPALARDRYAVDSLRREALISRQLAHDHICRLHSFHSDGDVKFIVMEYVDGQTLAHLLQQRPDRRMPLAELEPIVRQIAAALDYAHATTYSDTAGRRVTGVLHRDIKPPNIMVNRDSVAKLMDFGIAREIHNTMTQVTGRQPLTPLYASPEQFRGEPLTAASDIYSFGAVLYECLTGHPYVAPHGDLAWQILQREFAPLADLPPSVSSGLGRAMSKSPGDRPATALAMITEIFEARPAPAPRAAPPAAPPPVHAAPTRSKRAAAPKPSPSTRKPAAESPGEFDLILESAGRRKLEVIKVVREARLDLGLKGAKDFIERLPNALLEQVPKDVAEAWQARLEAAGATASVEYPLVPPARPKAPAPRPITVQVPPKIAQATRAPQPPRVSAPAPPSVKPPQPRAAVAPAPPGVVMARPPGVVTATPTNAAAPNAAVPVKAVTSAARPRAGILRTGRNCALAWGGCTAVAAHFNQYAHATTDPEIISLILCGGLAPLLIARTLGRTALVWRGRYTFFLMLAWLVLYCAGKVIEHNFSSREFIPHDDLNFVVGAAFGVVVGLVCWRAQSRFTLTRLVLHGAAWWAAWGCVEYVTWPLLPLAHEMGFRPSTPAGYIVMRAVLAALGGAVGGTLSAIFMRLTSSGPPAGSKPVQPPAAPPPSA
jgi:ribosomal protein L7/L12